MSFPIFMLVTILVIGYYEIKHINSYNTSPKDSNHKEPIDGHPTTRR